MTKYNYDSKYFKHISTIYLDLSYLKKELSVISLCVYYILCAKRCFGRRACMASILLLFCI